MSVWGYATRDTDAFIEALFPHRYDRHVMDHRWHIRMLADGFELNAEGKYRRPEISYQELMAKYEAHLKRQMEESQ